MPKRKRSAYDDANGDNGNRVLKMRKKDVEDRLAQGKKHLHRALKLAKGFERQKLGKRLKAATTAGETEQIRRINTEINVLKGLDLAKVAENHLYKTLKKIKSFVGSELLPGYVMTGADMKLEEDGASEEDITALRNVTSGMFNIKNVKDVMKLTIGGMYVALGIPKPEEKSMKKQNPKESTKDGSLKSQAEVLANGTRNELNTRRDENTGGLDDADELPWEGFDDEEDADNASNNQDESESVSEDDQEEYGSELEEEELSKWDALLGGSSDEESFDEETYKKSHPAHKPRQSLSLSPSLSPSPSLSGSSSSSTSSQSRSPSPPPSSAKAKTSRPSRSQPEPKPIGGSTFLPTLMGGYWSGSESASDLEDDPATAAPVHKNRKGQQARRAIWEKKYGAKANHVVKGLGKEKDDGWDPKRGAKSSSGSDWKGRKGANFRDRQGGRGRNFATATGENAVTIKPRDKAGGDIRKRDDVGTLHPSWQAAKKAKQTEKTATFQGKKLVFD
ncbi:Bud-site selection protein [Xylogone sp. PMI_703]|nr:Bud-site selection protein [Xylogone sp. PMI_703]